MRSNKNIIWKEWESTERFVKIIGETPDGMYDTSHTSVCGEGVYQRDVQVSKKILSLIIFLEDKKMMFWTTYEVMTSLVFPTCKIKYINKAREKREGKVTYCYSLYVIKILLRYRKHFLCFVCEVFCFCFCFSFFSMLKRFCFPLFSRLLPLVTGESDRRFLFFQFVLLTTESLC